MEVRSLDIFDFLKNNIYFVVVALFVLFKLFGGSKAKTSTTGAPKPQQQGNDGTREADYRQYEEPQFTAYEDTVSDTPRVFKQQHYVEPLKTAEANATAHTYQPPVRQKSHNAQQHERGVKTERSIHVKEQLTKQNIRQAVLWAEILGPPRAKKPYRRK